MQVTVSQSPAYVLTKHRPFPKGTNFYSACFCYFYIQVERGDHESEQAIFSVPDYTGNACKSVGMIHHVKQSHVSLISFKFLLVGCFWLITIFIHGKKLCKRAVCVLPWIIDLDDILSLKCGIVACSYGKILKCNTVNSL